VNKDAPPTTWSTVAIEPASRQLLTIVGNINATRLQQPASRSNLWEMSCVACPDHSIAIPQFQGSGSASLRLSDVVYERIRNKSLAPEGGRNVRPLS